MRNMIIIFLTVIGLGAPSVFAQTTNDGTHYQTMSNDSPSKNIGLGIILGEPTGLSAKVNIGPTFAIDVAAAWAFSGEDAFHLHGDFLNHARHIFAIEEQPFDLHYGVGLRTKFNENSDTDVGIRFPVGLDYMFQKVPIELFFEIAGIIDIAPDTDFELNAGIGGRFFF